MIRINLKKVLVTGADGFIGNHLTESLLEKGNDVKAFAYYNSFNTWGEWGEWGENKLIHKETGKQVKALVVVHVFGNMADMESIMEIANTYHLKVIEDAIEALGSRYTQGMYAGKFAGTIGDFGAYSFNGNKIITTGGGGAVTARDAECLEHLKYLSTQAKDDPHFYIHNEVGYNYRMTNLQVALGVAQLEELPEFIERKHRNYNLYQQEKGVQTRAIWGLIHEQMPYQDTIAYKVEKAPYYSNCILNIPCSTQITEEDIIYVVQQIKGVLEENAE